MINMVYGTVTLLMERFPEAKPTDSAMWRATYTAPSACSLHHANRPPLALSGLK